MTTDSTPPPSRPRRSAAPASRSRSRSTRERIAAYAAATNDPIAAHAAGDLAPPVFAIVPAFQAPGWRHEVIPGELLGAILHGEQDFHFHRPIEPGMTLEHAPRRRSGCASAPPASRS